MKQTVAIASASVSLASMTAETTSKSVGAPAEVGDASLGRRRALTWSPSLDRYEAVVVASVLVFRAHLGPPGELSASLTPQEHSTPFDTAKELGGCTKFASDNPYSSVGRPRSRQGFTPSLRRSFWLRMTRGQVVLERARHARLGSRDAGPPTQPDASRPLRIDWTSAGRSDSSGPTTGTRTGALRMGRPTIHPDVSRVRVEFARAPSS